MKNLPPMKVIHFHAKASRNQAARWSYWARWDGYSSIGAWLERLADREVERWERQGGYLPPEPPD